MLFQKSREFSQTKFFALKQNWIQCSLLDFQFLKINFCFKTFAQDHDFLFLAAKAFTMRLYSEETRRKEKKKSEDKKVSTIVTVLPIYLTIKTRTHYTHFGAPRSRERVTSGMWKYPIELSTLFKGEFLLLFPALRLHLEGDRCLQLENSSSLSFLSKIPGVLSNGPDETYSLRPPQHHALLIRTSFQINKLKEFFFVRLKRIVITSEDRAVSGPCTISLKKYTGPRPRGFLFLATKEHEGHEGEEQGAGSREQGAKEEEKKVSSKSWR
jgi:hypothetical protein